VFPEPGPAHLREVALPADAFEREDTAFVALAATDRSANSIAASFVGNPYRFITRRISSSSTISLGG
jgi:hypothetical protein